MCFVHLQYTSQGNRILGGINFLRFDSQKTIILFVFSEDEAFTVNFLSLLISRTLPVEVTPPLSESLMVYPGLSVCSSYVVTSYLFSNASMRSSANTCHFDLELTDQLEPLVVSSSTPKDLILIVSFLL